MAGELPVVRVGEHCRSVSDTHALDCDEIIFLNTSDILRGEVLTNAFSDTRTLPGQAKKRVAHGDILFSEIRPANGRFAVFDEPNPDRYVVSTKLMVIRPRPTIDTAYLYLFLTSHSTLGWLQHLAESRSGTFPQITFDQIAELEIPLPSLPEQRAIAAVLGALDDKIEVNRKRARVLEGIARVVFTSWFVNFDPVRRAVAGQPTGLPPDLTVLFSKQLVDSPIGEVPEGWRVGTLTEDFNLMMGHSPPGSTYNEVGDGLPFYQGRTDYGFRFPTPRVYCTEPTRFAEPGDTLVSVRAPVGDVNMAIERCAVGRGVAAVRHRRGSRSLTYYAMHALRPYFLRFEADGTVFGAIGKTDFERLPFVAPPPPVVDAFERLAAPIDQRIEGCERQSATLAALRDALLPKLISGDLRIADAETILGRAV